MKNKIFLSVMLIAAMILCSCMVAVDTTHQDEQSLEGGFVGAEVAQTTNDEEELSPVSEDPGNDFVSG